MTTATLVGDVYILPVADNTHPGEMPTLFKKFFHTREDGNPHEVARMAIVTAEELVMDYAPKGRHVFGMAGWYEFAPKRRYS